jgi:hypothetical protein
MNKNKICEIAIIALMYSVMIIACKGPNDPVNTYPVDGLGTISINFGGGNARTLLPSEIDITKLHYVLNFTQKDGSGNLRETQNGSGQLTLQLNIGIWDLVIRGYNSENDATDTSKALVSYTQNGIIIPFGNSVTIHARLLPDLDNLTQNGSGTLRYNITFPVGAAGVLKMYTYPAKMQVGSTVILTETINTGELELSSGYYYINVHIENGDKVQVWSELAHINDNAITEAIISPNDFTDSLLPPGPIDIYLSMDKFTLTDEGAGVFSNIAPIILDKNEGTTKIIAAEGLVVIGWWIGDVIIGTGNNITLNAELYPIGVYALNLTFIKDGKPWLASLTFEVVGSDPIKVTNTIEWENALTQIRNGGNDQNYIIAVSGDVPVSGTYENSFGWVTNLSVTLRGEGKLYLISQGSIIRVADNQNLNINSVILEGLTNGQNYSSQDNNTEMVWVSGNNARIELRDGVVRGNTNSNTTWFPYSGGGIRVQNGTFVMKGNATVYNNTAEHAGGGVLVIGGAFSMHDNASVQGNTVDLMGGGVYVIDGTYFIMQDNATVYNNTSSVSAIHVNNGIFIMQDNAMVHGNDGGGVYGFPITFTMQNNASVYDNIGTGVYVGDNHWSGVFIEGIFTMHDSASVHGNSLGVYVDGTFIMQDNTSVYNNSQGVFVNSGIFTMQDNASVQPD